MQWIIFQYILGVTCPCFFLFVFVIPFLALFLSFLCLEQCAINVIVHMCIVEYLNNEYSISVVE